MSRRSAMGALVQQDEERTKTAERAASERSRSALPIVAGVWREHQPLPFCPEKPRDVRADRPGVQYRNTPPSSFPEQGSEDPDLFGGMGGLAASY